MRARPLLGTAVLVVVTGTTLAAAPAPADAAPAHSSRAAEPAYATLNAPGWHAVRGDGPGDAKVQYVNGHDEVRLAWHPRTESRKPYKVGVHAGTTTMDGDLARIFVYQSLPTVVGPARSGYFLTLTSSTLDEKQIADLAGQVHRR